MAGSNVSQAGATPLADSARHVRPCAACATPTDAADGRCRDCGPDDLAGTRFPRTAAVLEAARAADVLRTTAAALDALASDASRYAPDTLRRKARALRVEAANLLLGMTLALFALLAGGCATPVDPVPSVVEANVELAPLSSATVCSVGVPEADEVRSAVDAWARALNMSLVVDERAAGADVVGCDVVIALGGCSGQPSSSCSSTCTPGACAHTIELGSPGPTPVHLVPGVYEIDVRGIVMHELGHVFGAGHTAEGLMAPVWHEELRSMTCPDADAVGAVVEAGLLDVSSVSPCRVEVLQ